MSWSKSSALSREPARHLLLFSFVFVFFFFSDSISGPLVPKGETQWWLFTQSFASEFRRDPEESKQISELSPLGWWWGKVKVNSP